MLVQNYLKIGAGILLFLLAGCSSISQPANENSLAAPNVYFKAAPFVIDGYWNENRSGMLSSVKMIDNTLAIEYESRGIVSTLNIHPLYINFDYSIYSQLQFSGIEEDEGPIGIIRLKTSQESSNRPLPGELVIGDNLGTGDAVLPGLTIQDITDGAVTFTTASQDRSIKIGEFDVVSVEDRLYTVYVMHSFIPRPITDSDIEDRGRKSCDIMLVSYDYESFE